MPKFEIKVTIIVEAGNVVQAVEAAKPLWHDESIEDVTINSAKELPEPDPS